MSLIHHLFESAIDVVGDLHGELEALERLLSKLGYHEDGRHEQRRHLVFVGDLIDRGPDSPGVLRKVMGLVEAGRAQCIVGNHELNALRDDPAKRRSGEGWWYGRHENGYSWQTVSPQEKERRFMPFLRSLPGALEREDLRIVHACWHDASIDFLRAGESIIDLYLEREESLRPELAELLDDAIEARKRAGCTPEMRYQVDREFPFLPEIARYEEQSQMANPIKVLTSGVERQAGSTYYSSGKWRLVERVKWWDEYDDVPVVVGHYWRRYDPEGRGAPEGPSSDLFIDTPPNEWLGPARKVMCIDYSVGYRFAERRAGGPGGSSQYCLAALRVPEWELCFDDARRPLRLGPPGRP